MTEKEAIKEIKRWTGILMNAGSQCVNETAEAQEMAIKALEEIQQYRVIGTVEQVKNQKHNLEVAYKIIGNYQGIGTVEECRELKERNTPKKAKLISGLSPMCPECGASILKNYDNCKRCGQAID